MGSEHRATILQAATEVFARYGFKKASIDDIARRAAIGKGTVYLHFDSKEALFAAVARDVWVRVYEHLRAAVRQARTPDAKLRAFCRTRLDELSVLARTLNIAAESALELITLAKPSVHELRERELALIEEILAEGVAKDVFVVRKPRAFAVGLLGWLEALVPFFMPGAAQELREGTDEVLEVVLRGLAAKPGAPSAPGR
jgi:AcrR family transcriptional regulator